MYKARLLRTSILTPAAVAVMAAMTSIIGARWVRPEPLQAWEGAQTSTPPPGPIFKSITRLVVVDAVVTRHGRVVDDLGADDFAILDEKNRPQKIAHFEFIDKSKEAAPVAAAAPAGAGKVYSNQVAFEKLRLPPTILLMDALNTQIANQMSLRREMLLLMKTLPANTPVAVLLLGRNLRVVQGFTSDPAVLRTAVDKVLKPSMIQGGAQDEAMMSQDFEVDEGISSFFAADAYIYTSMLQENLATFETETYVQTMDTRVHDTIAALTAIAHLLSGYRGRKSLIWFTESIPFSFELDVGQDAYVNSQVRRYGPQIQAAANALSDAQIAVYPVDAEGVTTSPAVNAASQTAGMVGPVTGRSTTGNRGPGSQGQFRNEDSAQAQNQATMEKIATDTGGKTCRNTNDLSGCVTTALNDSSSYYELAFYPEGVTWDGSFHRIHLKTSRHGVDLDYRRGYFAKDPERPDKPNERLQQACADWLPSTAIPLTARSANSGAQQGHVKYLLSVAPAVSHSFASGESRAANLRLGVCEFNEKGIPTRTYSSDFGASAAGSGARNVRWGVVDLAPLDDTRRVRFEVIDTLTGDMGGLDVPFRPEDRASAPPPPTPAPPPSQGPSPRPPVTSMTFKSSTGQSGTLDWGGDKIIYYGSLSSGLAAQAIFQQYIQTKYHCASGVLVPNDPGGSPPRMYWSFKNKAGQSAGLDIARSQLQFSGDIPPDDTAKAFFQRVWEAFHCQDVTSPAK